MHTRAKSIEAILRSLLDRAQLSVIDGRRRVYVAWQAELGWRYTAESERYLIVGMNLVVTFAVTLTFPVQFYPVSN